MSPTEAFMPDILARLAPHLDAEVLLEPEYRIVGRIRFRNGRQSYFWHNKFNLNPVGAARIAADKGYTNFFLAAEGIRVPRERAFFAPRFRRILQSNRDVEAACARGWAKERTLLVQEACPGRDYRLVILDGKLISAYERIPLTIAGDGRRTIGQLLSALQRRFEEEGRDTIIDPKDRRIEATLRREKLTKRTVLARGRKLRLLEVANLSCGGTSAEVTAQVAKPYIALAARVSAALGLRFAGIDLIAPDIRRYAKRHWVLEVNSAPGLDHYAGHGPEHQAAIDRLYLKVLRAVEQGPPEAKPRSGRAKKR